MCLSCTRVGYAWGLCFQRVGRHGCVSVCVWGVGKWVHSGLVRAPAEALGHAMHFQRVCLLVRAGGVRAGLLCAPAEALDRAVQCQRGGAHA